MEREVDQWLNTDEWEVALQLHNLMCKLGHQMDQCWGLVLPYDLNQPTLSDIQRFYLTRAQKLIQLTGSRLNAETVIAILSGRI